MDIRSESGPEWPAIERFLAERGADGMPHPGGTLLEHLIRVRQTLAAWGATPAVQAAGLCHAAYGTDGFPHALLDLTERGALTAVIGERAESLVYLYGSCERRMAYAQLGGEHPVVFRDRFAGAERTPAPADLRAFMEITAANELDVLAHNPEIATRHGRALNALFARSHTLLSAAARDACTRQLGRHAAEPGPGFDITGLDHLVLTVADLERTTEFYRRALGMRPIAFGEGRRALAFGPSKINLHQAGHELSPHAVRPTPGSADLCLITTASQDHVRKHLSACAIPVEQGPVPRTGALGPITSTYLRDPDGNLIEISTYNDSD